MCVASQCLFFYFSGKLCFHVLKSPPSRRKMIFKLYIARGADNECINKYFQKEMDLEGDTITLI